MNYRNLGTSGVKVSELSFGSWVSFSNQLDVKQAIELMSLAYDRGVNFFDNAEVYAHGASELIMGEALKKLAWDRSSYLVSSKAYFGRGIKKPNMTGLSRKHLVEACHEALTRLRLDYLDFFFAHRPDKSTPIEETVWTMHQLIMQGKILYWGTSEWSAQEITEAYGVAKQHHLIGPSMEQVQYNLLTRDKVEREFLQLFKHFGLGTTIWSPLASGILTGKYSGGKIPNDSRMALKEYEWLKEKNLTEKNHSLILQLEKLAKKLNVSLTKLSIAWCLTNPNVSTVLLGATKMDQLKENLDSAEFVYLFTTEVIEEIESILCNKPKQPSF